MSYTVYKHICPNGMVYIGITNQDVNKRWGGGMGYQENKKFFQAIVKYGWDNIQHVILYEGLSQRKAYNIEKRLIEQCKSNDPVFGFNISSGGGSPGEGVHHKKASPAVTHERPKGDLAYNAKRICQFDLHGNYIRTWGSGKSISEHFNLKNATGVSRSCKFETIAYRGYFWLYEDESNRIDEKVHALEKCSARQYDCIVSWQRQTHIA